MVFHAHRKTKTNCDCGRHCFNFDYGEIVCGSHKKRETLEQVVKCDSCKKQWVDVYQYIGTNEE